MSGEMVLFQPKKTVGRCSMSCLAFCLAAHEAGLGTVIMAKMHHRGVGHPEGRLAAARFTMVILMLLPKLKAKICTRFDNLSNKLEVTMNLNESGRLYSRIR